ncbi:hypothetical protein MMC28_009693 [Mycoblastus sanguinarius]|nr:hypothetical protein [Mycoblastus sanguinarius]
MKIAALTATSSLSLPTDSYIYRVLPVKSTLAAISSDDSLRLIDSATLREISGGILDRVHDGVTCLTNLDSDQNSLLTAGRDAAVRCWDLRSGKKRFELLNESKAPKLSLASRSFHIAAGTELDHSQAAVSVWDWRSANKPLVHYVESHNDDVTELQIHPTDPSCLLSGSTDGLVNTYNTNIADEDDALIQVTNHGSSINHAEFLSNSQFFALSHDENFSVYDFGSNETLLEASSPTVFGNLRPQLDCEYVVDVIPSSSGLEAIMGAGSHSKKNLDLIPLRLMDRWSLDPSQAIRLPGAHGDEVVRSMCFNHEAQAIFTAGEDGLIKAWRTPAAQHEQDQDQQSDFERPKKKKKKDIEKGEGEKSRFRPY